MNGTRFGAHNCDVLASRYTSHYARLFMRRFACQGRSLPGAKEKRRSPAQSLTLDHGKRRVHQLHQLAPANIEDLGLQGHVKLAECRRFRHLSDQPSAKTKWPGSPALEGLQRCSASGGGCGDPEGDGTSSRHSAAVSGTSKRCARTVAASRAAKRRASESSLHFSLRLRPLLQKLSCR